MTDLKATKHYCAVKTKYYKDSQASVDIGHILSSFEHNDNCFSALTKNNIGHIFSAHNLNIKQYHDMKLIEAKTAITEHYRKTQIPISTRC